MLRLPKVLRSLVGVFILLLCSSLDLPGQPDGERLTAEQYIEQWKEVAVRKMKEHGIPASITLAQGLLESGNGNSKLAREANNHFGIKCTPDWTGGKSYHDDDKKDDCFRKYKDAAQSYEDHAKFLQKPRYASLFELKPTDYEGWARGLKKAGYATDPAYPQKLISLIERYRLNDLDRGVDVTYKPAPKPEAKPAPTRTGRRSGGGGGFTEKSDKASSSRKNPRSPPAGAILRVPRSSNRTAPTGSPTEIADRATLPAMNVI